MSMRRKATYEPLEHTADIRVRLVSETLEGLFESAVLVMTELICEDLAGEESEFHVSVEGNSVEQQLIELLSELLFQFDIQNTLVVAAEVAIDGSSVSLSGRTIVFDPRRHTGLCEIKAATYHQLSVRRCDDQWTTTIVFDV